MNWATWGPLVLTGVGWIFLGGIFYNRLTNVEKRTDDLEIQRDDDRKTMNAQAVKIGMLEAWKDGYAAARAVYDKMAHAIGD